MSKRILTFKITCLSDTCCGSGVGNGSDVDVTACFDEYGLPMIPGKRLRGMLRENALRLSETYGMEGGVPYPPEAVADLFGDSGRHSRLRVNSAAPEDADAIRAGVVSYPPQEVSGVFTVKRAQTAVDPATGTAKKGSLRVTQTVRKGAAFLCEVTVDAPAEYDARIIKDAFAVLRGIGMDRRRGLGEVRCESCGEKDLPDPAEALGAVYEKTGDLFRLPYTLTLRSDLLLMLNSPMQNPDHIPGAAVQGAFAALFAGAPYFSELFFNDLKFTNACISDGARDFAPMPLSFVAVKNEPDTVFDLAAGYEKDEAKQYVPVNGYGCVSGNTLLLCPVNTGTDYHLNKGRSNSAGVGFYNAFKISRGQRFRGAVYGSRGALALIERLCPDTLRIGASVSSEYGVCGVSFAPAAPVETLSAKKGDVLVARLLSDAAVIDPNGANSLRLADLVEGLCGPGVFEVQTDADGLPMAWLKTGAVSGYNKKWGMPRQQYLTFCKGGAVALKALCDIPALPLFTGAANAEGCGLLSWTTAAAPKTYTLKKAASAEKTAVASEAANRVVAEIEDARTRRAVTLEALKAANRLHSDTLSGSAAMRILTLYQGLREGGRPLTPDLFDAEAEKFKKNRELTRLAKAVTARFREAAFDDAYFELYLRTFIGRYKEIGQTKRAGARSEGGEENA